MVHNPVISPGGTHCIGFSGGDGVLSYGFLLVGDHTGADVADEGGPLHEAVVARNECGGVVSRRVDEGDFHGSILAPIARVFRRSVRQNARQENPPP